MILLGICKMSDWTILSFYVFTVHIDDFTYYERFPFNSWLAQLLETVKCASQMVLFSDCCGVRSPLHETVMFHSIPQPMFIMI